VGKLRAKTVESSPKPRRKAKSDAAAKAAIEKKHAILQFDPRKLLEVANKAIRRNPKDHGAYYDRHFAWDRLGKLDLALADLDKALSLRDHPVTRVVRGNLLHKMRRYQDAIDELDRMQTKYPKWWPVGFADLTRADCHARLGNVEAALADCASLHEETWTPGLNGLPPGDKERVTAFVATVAPAVRDAIDRRAKGASARQKPKAPLHDGVKAGSRRRSRDLIYTSLWDKRLKRHFGRMSEDGIAYRALADERIRKDPRDPNAWFLRHYAWPRRWYPERALTDLDKALALQAHPMLHQARGTMLRELRRYEEAVAAFDRAEVLESNDRRNAYFRLYRADCLACIGDLEAVRADCARLPENFRSSGHQETPAGTKAEVTAVLERVAHEIRRGADRRLNRSNRAKPPVAAAR
jgi:tetratricopeptide (TPR) repeat protein